LISTYRYTEWHLFKSIKKSVLKWFWCKKREWQQQWREQWDKPFSFFCSVHSFERERVYTNTVLTKLKNTEWLHILIISPLLNIYDFILGENIYSLFNCYVVILHLQQEKRDKRTLFDVLSAILQSAIEWVVLFLQRGGW
jgi:hypothetical protein